MVANNEKKETRTQKQTIIAIITPVQFKLQTLILMGLFPGTVWA